MEVLKDNIQQQFEEMKRLFQPNDRVNASSTSFDVSSYLPQSVCCPSNPALILVDDSTIANPAPPPNAAASEPDVTILVAVTDAVNQATKSSKTASYKDPRVEFGFQLMIRLFQKQEIISQTISGKRNKNKFDSQKMLLVKQQLIQKFDCTEEELNKTLNEIALRLKNYRRKLK